MQSCFTDNVSVTFLLINLTWVCLGVVSGLSAEEVVPDQEEDPCWVHTPSLPVLRWCQGGLHLPRRHPVCEELWLHCSFLWRCEGSGSYGRTVHGVCDQSKRALLRWPGQRGTILKNCQMHLVQNYYTTVQKFGVSTIKKRKKKLIQQGCIKWLKKDIRDFTLLKKISISNKSCSFELSIHFRINTNVSSFTQC